MQDPADTFDKILERNLVIAMPTGTVIDQLFKTSPFETMRLAYEFGKENGGFYPWGQLMPRDLYNTLLKGDAVSLLTDDLHVGRRHIVEISKVERLIGYMPKGFMFKMNSKLRTQMEPILGSLIESGIYEHLKQVFLWHRARPERVYYRFKQPKHLVILNWERVGWSFVLIVFSGMSVSALAFVGEVLLYRETSMTFELIVH